MVVLTLPQHNGLLAKPLKVSVLRFNDTAKIESGQEGEL